MVPRLSFLPDAFGGLGLICDARLAQAVFLSLADISFFDD